MPSAPYFSKTIEKGLAIMGLFDRDHTRRNLTEISKITGINKTSTFRFINTLVKLGYLKKCNNNRLIKLGPKALLFAHNFFQGNDLLQAVKSSIDKTFTEYKITIDSALLDDLKLISLYRRESLNIIHFRLPLVMEELHARAMGKAVLAYINDSDLSRFLDQMPMKKLTPKTLDRRETLLADLELTRNRGYSINDEEYITGLICVGAPLMNYQSKSVIGAISLDFPTSEQSLESVQKNYTGILTKLAGEISEIITMSDN
jgi:DNA-binding IclR family transcriptional regulator